jgi:hypothetical protein
MAGYRVSRRALRATSVRETWACRSVAGEREPDSGGAEPVIARPAVRNAFRLARDLALPQATPGGPARLPRASAPGLGLGAPVDSRITSDGSITTGQVGFRPSMRSAKMPFPLWGPGTTCNNHFPRSERHFRAHPGPCRTPLIGGLGLTHRRNAGGAPAAAWVTAAPNRGRSLVRPRSRTRRSR